MAKIENLFPREHADGSVNWHWKPSPRLRRLGYINIDMGTDFAKAVTEALAQNARVAEEAAQLAASAPRPRVTRHMTMRELILDYERTEFSPDRMPDPLKPGTIKQYRWCNGIIEKWADDGRAKVRLIDADMIETFKDSLMAVSLFNAKAVLGQLKRLLGRAKKPLRVIDANPFDDVEIAEARPRNKRITIDALRTFEEWARPLYGPDLARYLLVGFYTTQRQGDVLALTQFNWGTLDDIADEDKRELGGLDGFARGFTLTQKKTGTHVAVPVPPDLAAIVEGVWRQRKLLEAECTHLIRFPTEDRPCPAWKLQRLFREARDAAIEHYRGQGDNWMVDQLEGLTLRDLRRSGMCWMRELGVTPLMIASISGHTIDETTKILETYLPRDSRAAAAGMAMAVRRQGERDAIKKEAQG